MPAAAPRRADAERNRDKILAAARAAFAEPGVPVSMAEISRRAGVGMATLYRNFPGRRELLEALYVDEVDAVCAAAATVDGDTAGTRFTAWLRRFIEFFTAKHEVGALLAAGGADRADAVDRADDDSFFNANRDRVLAAGRPLLIAAQQAGEVRDDITLEQALDMILAVATITGDDGYREAILRVALDGLATRRGPDTSH